MDKMSGAPPAGSGLPSEPCFLGVDIGSGSVKAVVFNDAGVERGHGQAAYPTNHPGPNRAEADPELIWAAVVAAVHAAVDGLAVAPQAMALAAHGESVLPVDAHGAALGPMLMNADNRAVAEAAAIGRALGQNDGPARYHAITGLPLHPMYAIAKMQWLARHEPERFAQAAWWLGPAEYTLLRLGLPVRSEPSLAARTGALDLAGRTWSSAILAAAGVAESRLPPLIPAGRAVGSLSAAAAAELGLPSGIPVALAGHDQVCGALGAGCVQPGDTGDSAGTYECLTAISAQRPASAQALPLHLNTGPHVVDGLFATLAFFPAGMVVQWLLAATVAPEDQAAFLAGLDDRLTAIPGPTGVCILPHLVGACTPHWNAQATGAMLGLTPRTGRDQLFKAVFEGLACELAENVDALRTLVGPCERIRIFGGNARCPATVRLRADLTGCTFVAAPREAVCLGAAMLAATAAGRFADPVQAARAMGRSDGQTVPDPALVRAYRPQRQVYQAFNQAMIPLHAALAAIPT